LECTLGSYKFDGIEIPQEALVLYINPNPRNLKKASYILQKRIIDLLEKDQNYNIHAEALSCIGQAKSKTRFIDFDIDDKNVDLLKLNEIFQENSYSVMETRGGFHVLIKTFEPLPKGNWFLKMENLFDVDKSGDQLLPMPGAVQGDFVPFFLKK
jgi:hypothetical protein